jgi:regulator of protease activity HflC (stomatin/prohibitin superfamily)
MKTEQYTKDIQQADTDISVTFNLDPNHIIKMHKDTGKDYAEKLIGPAIVGCAKDVFGKWNATDVIAKREEATEFIVKGLKNKLEPYGIHITLVELLDISFKPKFEDAVEAKQIAEQEASRAKNLTVKIKEEAQQKIIAAEAEAKAMEVRAKALESNKSLVEYEAVMKWNGELPQYMMGDSIPFINMNVKK